mmetsp:Transcript_5650/g.13200  ORF Transcript_5650/g.13200 Transcript_5650/m.13200 type:complete len:214 (-) Transcript_5650:882-1523(-)
MLSPASPPEPCSTSSALQWPESRGPPSWSPRACAGIPARTVAAWSCSVTPPRGNSLSQGLVWWGPSVRRAPPSLSAQACDCPTGQRSLTLPSGQSGKPLLGTAAQLAVGLLPAVKDSGLAWLRSRLASLGAAGLLNAAPPAKAVWPCPTCLGSVLSVVQQPAGQLPVLHQATWSSQWPVPQQRQLLQAWDAQGHSPLALQRPPGPHWGVAAGR